MHELMKDVATHRVIAILRTKDASALVEIAEALWQGGIKLVEVTMTVPDALEVIRACVKAHGEKIVVGAGTVLDPETARAAVDAGARFIVSPVTDVEVIDASHQCGAMVLPGAMTPNEIYQAWKLGADAVKVFSARAGGPGFLKDIKGPLPDIPLVPTAGVDLANAADFIRAGALAVGLGSQLVTAEMIEERRFEEITAKASQLVKSVQEAAGS
ncbi:KHG/KDPG aldolase [Planctomycetes bacterium Pan216]|uniref:KHG/KDPG aldolase n=1 Tax=Kolteria novifilia TaxID=2527975 RepID=A0A518B465_9BACT|nr:KHG/KDPG aldolase [Planctomycetes bacterium Pan216]